MTSDLVERLRSRKEPTIEVDMHYPQIVDSDTPDAECLEAAARIERLEEEVKVWVNHAKTAVWSDSEECKLLTRINEALIAAPTVDVDVVVPDRDYSTMTPRDCYEAGLLDGVYQAREAIKAAARAALEGE